MNNDELLAMYLDGTLSEGQRADFDRLLQTSPTFAQEVREILAIQDMLLIPSGSDERTTAFLRTVEDHLAGAVVAAGAAATVGAVSIAAGKSAIASGTITSGTVAGTATVGASAGTAATSIGAASWASSLLSTAFASTTSMVVSVGIGVATVVGGAATVNYIVKKNTNPQAISEQSPAGQAAGRTEQSAATQSQGNNAQNLEAQNLDHQETAPQASTANHTPPDITAQRQADVQSGTSAPQSGSTSEARVAAANDGKPREYTARITGGGMQARTTAAISDYTKQLQAKIAANDRTGAAFVEKSLGVLLRQAGQLRESRQHLSSTAKAAHELGLQELEGEALAETALIDAAEGKKERAVQGLQAALGLLNSAKSSTTVRWQKELDKLTSK